MKLIIVGLLSSLLGYFIGTHDGYIKAKGQFESLVTAEIDYRETLKAVESDCAFTLPCQKGLAGEVIMHHMESAR